MRLTTLLRWQVLSVQTALSIQAHPDKELAERLHASRPDLYKDDNHKPEMALAVSRFEALCSFQKANHVLENTRACPELVAVVGEDAVNELARAAELAAPLTPALQFARAPNTSKANERVKSGEASPDVTGERHSVVKPALQQLFTRLMKAEPLRVKKQLDALVRHMNVQCQPCSLFPCRLGRA